MKLRNLILFILSSLFLLLAVSGCQKEQTLSPDGDFTAEQQELKAFLPEKAGYKWVHHGFAEYGHTLELLSIQEQDNETLYITEGELYDASDGEAGFDLSLNVRYVIKEGAIIQERTNKRMMDTFERLTLLLSPVKKGTRWEQEVKDAEGKYFSLECAITNIQEENGLKTVTVEYKDKNSEFYEKRLIREKTGVISFEKRIKLGTEDVVMGYYLYEDMSGYPQKTSLLSHLPPTGQILRYFGLAEYAHEGTLRKTSQTGEKSIYVFEGEFTDGSGIPGSFKVQYTFDYEAGTLQEKVLENTRSGKKEVNSKLHDPIILKYPLVAGSFWSQEIEFEGQKKTMTARILNVGLEGHTFYSQLKEKHPVTTVCYVVEGVPGYYQDRYVEVRRFQPGYGMIGYNHLFKGDLPVSAEMNEYRIEQELINNMFGYSLAKHE